MGCQRGTRGTGNVQGGLLQVKSASSKIPRASTIVLRIHKARALHKLLITPENVFLILIMRCFNYK